MEINVLAVIGQLEMGGTERHLLDVFSELNRAPLACSVYALRAGGSLEPAFAAAGIRVISPQRYSRRCVDLGRAARHLSAILRAERPDILHFFLPEAYLLGGLCSLTGPRCLRVMSRRSLNRYQQKWPMSRTIERFLHRRMDCILANSAAVLAELEEEGVTDAVSGLIYNGVKVPAVRNAVADAELRRELHIDSDAVVVVMVANLISYKGHADVIEALSLARDRMPENWIILMIGGDTGIHEDLARQAAAAGVAPNIRWLGAIADVEPYLSISDLAVTASHEEGFSNAVLEAMAASLPQVVTAVGGNREAVIDGETGFVVPPRDPGAMAEAIATLAGDAELRDKFGRAARTRAGSKFMMESCVAAYRRVYLSLAHGGHESIKHVIGEGA